MWLYLRFFLNIFKENNMKKDEREVLIKVLGDFAKNYFRKNPPVVQWKYMKNGWCHGLVYRKERLIYLNPRSRNDRDEFCSVVMGGAVDFDYQSSIRIERLSKHEKFFLTLLHEIGHLKIRHTIPKHFRSIRKELRKKYPKDINKQFYLSANYFLPENNNDKKKYLERLESDLGGCFGFYSTPKIDRFGSCFGYPELSQKSEKIYFNCLYDMKVFQSWFQGDYIPEHIAVVDWARGEFLTRREEIQEILIDNEYSPISSRGRLLFVKQRKIIGIRKPGSAGYGLFEFA